MLDLELPEPHSSVSHGQLILQEEGLRALQDENILVILSKLLEIKCKTLIIQFSYLFNFTFKDETFERLKLECLIEHSTCHLN